MTQRDPQASVRLYFACTLISISFRVVSRFILIYDSISCS